MVTQDTNGGPPLTDEIAALPGVAAASSATFVFGALLDSQGEAYDALVFSGEARPLGMALVSGRAADPSDPSEFIASRSFTKQMHAAIGDSFQLVTLSAEQVHTEGFTGSDPQGPQSTVTLVDGPTQLEDPSTIVLVSPALPLAIVGVGGVAVLVVANAIAALPARRASRMQPASILRTD